MASISVEQKAGGERRYVLRYRSPEGDSRKERFTRKAQAEARMAQVEHSKHTGAYVDTKAGRKTFGDYAEEWRKVQVHRPSTAAQVETNLRRHLLPAFGHRPIGAIRPSEVQACIRGRSDVLAPATVEVVYRLAVTIFRAAIADRLIVTSPCVGVKLPKAEPRRVVPLTVEQVEALIDAMPGRYQALVAFVATTGLRQGEAFGVTSDRLDFLRRQVTVDRQIGIVTGAPVLGPPKTRASYRTVPLPQITVDVLAAHLAEYPATGSDGFVFTNDKGEPIRRNRFRDVWRRAARAAELPDWATFHDLRHFYASLLIRHGESVVVVQSRLGHATAAETLDTYSHLWPDSDDRTREAVETAFSTARVQSVSNGAG